MNVKLKVEFDEIIKPLYSNPEVKHLQMYKQHGQVNRLTHSINVARVSFLLGKKYKLDAPAMARAGLLHDFYHSERFSIKEKKRSHMLSHASLAVINAREITNLSKKEENIIRSHMFPLSTVPPKSREAWIVSCVDKWMALVEIYDSWFRPKVRMEKGFEVCNTYVLEREVYYRDFKLNKE